MTDLSSARLESLIARRTGLKLRTRQRESLKRSALDRSAALGMSHSDQYEEFLESDSADANAEWTRLVGILTNNETYFFRDRGQIALLRDHILPELIQKNEATRTLRLWSAGCSTGEEAYTLAILVAELLPDAARLGGRGWDISILGTDIDESSLHHARCGVFGLWSFRTMDLATKRRHFTGEGLTWKISDECRSLIKIQTCNLVADDFREKGIGSEEVDLILCRNVFIYFEPAAVSLVLGKFAKCLKEGGYLMTGHVETSGQVIPTLHTLGFRDSEIWQKVRIETTGRSARTTPPRPPPEFRRERPPIVSAPPQESATSEDAGREKSLLIEARSLADIGRYSQAIRLCERLIGTQPLATEAYELLAAIAQEQGRAEDAKHLLKKAIYLTPRAPQLYIQMGAIYRMQGDLPRASTMEATALDLLRQVPPDSIVGAKDGPTARDCISFLTTIPRGGD